MSNQKYTKQFKLDAVQLAISSEQSTVAIARDLGLNPNSLYVWINQYRCELLNTGLELSPGKNLSS